VFYTCFLYAFMVYLRPVSRTYGQFKGTIWKESLYTLVYISFYVFTILLKHLRRLYTCGSIFKCCQYIITAPVNNHYTYWRTNPLLTKHWLIRGKSVLVYIDHVIYFNRTIIVTNLIRAYNTIRIPCLRPDCSMYHLSGTNNIKRLN
jgi:hypothetical protein